MKQSNSDKSNIGLRVGDEDDLLREESKISYGLAFSFKFRSVL